MDPLRQHAAPCDDGARAWQGCQMQELQRDLDGAHRRLQAAEAEAERRWESEAAARQELQAGQLQGTVRHVLPASWTPQGNPTPHMQVPASSNV